MLASLPPKCKRPQELSIVSTRKPERPKNMTMPSIEDFTRYTAPPEPRSEERWEEPEDHIDYIDTFTDEPE